MLELIEQYRFILIGLGVVSFLGLVFWISHRPVRGLYLAFFTSGILLTANLPVVRDKLTMTELVFLVTWFSLLLHHGKRKSMQPLHREQKLSIILAGMFILWTIISFGINNMVYTNRFISSLVETVNFAYGYLMFITTVMLAREVDAWHWGIRWWIAGSAVVVFFGVWATLGNAPTWAYEDFTHRVSSTLRNENQVPSYLLPMFVVMVYMAVKKGQSMRNQLAIWGLIAGTIITSFGTGSRTSLVMLLVACVGVAYVAMRTANHRSYRIAALLNMSLALIASLVVYISVALLSYEGDYALGRTPPWQRPVVMFYDWIQGHRQLDNTRPKQIAEVVENVGDHLIIGTGPKVYGGLFRMAEIHNTYAGLLLQTGVIGLLLFVLWLLHLLWRTFIQVREITDPWNKVLVLSLVVGMITLLLYNMTMFGLRQRTIWLLAGLLVASWSLTSYRNRRLSRGMGSSYEPAEDNQTSSELTLQGRLV